jgi:hypothetical protein
MDFIDEFEEAIKLWGDGKTAEAVATSRPEVMFELAETLALITRNHSTQNKPINENFSFIANSSLSGGRHPCSYFDCRQKKISQLITFASLYADEVYIQNPFEKIVLKGVDALGEPDKEELIHGISNYHYLKPLIKKGIIKYANNIVSLCEYHNDKLAKPLSKKITEKENKIYDLLHEYLIDKCSISFDVGKGAGPFLKITGPEGFIDHGEMYFHLYEPMPEYIETLRNKNLPYVIPKTDIINESILQLVISPILRDLSNQEWHTSFYGTSYLVDNPTQIKIASKINSQAYVANSEAFEKGMSHYLPAIYSKNVDVIMSLRDKEEEAFAVYRDKINKIIHQTKNWDSQEVSKMFRDQVLPEINIIDKKVKDWKHKTKESLKEKILFSTGAVSIGLYGGLLPTGFGQLLAAIGGGTAIVSTLIDYNKTLKEKEEARANDFYFLWQAKQ